MRAAIVVALVAAAQAVRLPMASPHDQAVFDVHGAESSGEDLPLDRSTNTAATESSIQSFTESLTESSTAGVTESLSSAGFSEETHSVTVSQPHPLETDPAYANNPSTEGLADEITRDYGTPAPTNPLEPPVQHPSIFLDNAPSDWDCHLHGWVRAPDLAPGTDIPAQARLVQNGTQCIHMSKVQIGLRFKERALVKMKAKDKEFPQYPRSNNTGRGWGKGFLARDLFKLDSYDPFHDPMDDKTAQLRADYSERIVFDTTMEYCGKPNDTIRVSESLIDVTFDFAVHIPPTNFPPVESVRWFSQSGGRGALAEVESIAEYYFLITLRGKYVFELPVGRTGFLPHPEPTALNEHPSAGGEEWPKAFTPKSPRTGNDTFALQQVPSCDEGNLAEFKVTIDKTAPAVRGTILTLDVTLERTGNGTEVPDIVSITQHVHHNYTWARDQVESDKEYRDLMTHASNLPHTMMIVKDRPTLEEECDRRSERELGLAPIARAWLPRHDTSYTFNITNDTLQDSYNFQMEVPIKYNEIPDFETTFDRVTHSFNFTLRTKFLCAPVEREAYDKMAIPDKVVETNDWREYELPTPQHGKPLAREVGRNTGTGLHRRTLGVMHRGSFPVKIVSPPPDNPISPAPIHYLDPEARGPRLSFSLDDRVKKFPLLGTIKPEDHDTLEKCRYHCRSPSTACFKPPCGGEKLHAAKLWQRWEAILRGEPSALPEGDTKYSYFSTSKKT